MKISNLSFPLREKSIAELEILVTTHYFNKIYKITNKLLFSRTFNYNFCPSTVISEYLCMKK